MRNERQRLSLFFCHSLERPASRQASGSFGLIRERWLSGEGGDESLLLSVIVCHIPDFLLHTKDTQVFISVDPCLRMGTLLGGLDVLCWEGG